MTERYAQVALPLPLADPYTYRIPSSLADRALPGARVVVPVRRREMVGVVVGVDVPPPPAAPRDLLAAPDADVALPPHLLELARQMSRYYGTPLGLTLRAMLPAALWGHSTVQLVLPEGRQTAVGGTAATLVRWLADRGGRGTVAAAARALKRPVWDVADRLQRVGALTLEVIPPDTSGGVATARVARMVGDPLTLVERDHRFKRAPRQRALYEALEARGGHAGVTQLLAAVDGTASSLNALAKSGLVELSTAEAPRDPFHDIAVSTQTPPPLTNDQLAALAALDVLPPGHASLLFGVTGSGKTRVYLDRIRHALDAGRGALLLVPEISLTPQTVGRVRSAFGAEVAVLHSGLSDGERADAWRALRSGARRIAIGARSAIFAPVRNLGVIVLDEEHEASYKNGEAPRYHARDVAAMRAHVEQATLILGSATPSLETWTRATEAGRVVRLPERVAAQPMPAVTLVDLRHEPQVEGVSGVPWTRVLDDAVTTSLSRGEQVLLLLNRRGWSAYVQCVSCGTVTECPNCSISLTVHRHPEMLRCHYCDYHEPVPTVCTICGGATPRSLGAGTQQLERLVAERFPQARVARMDLDTTTAKWSHHRILERVGRGEVDVLLGTQMIAKGLDFPNVTLVGVVDADTALHLPDFRAGERAFQLIAQVAGRAGRGPKGGRVVVQTRQPEHPALECAARHDVVSFLEIESTLRRSPAYPPHTALVHVVLSGPDRDAVARRAATVAEWCERTIARSELAVIVLGPAPCPVERIKDRWRMHLILKGASRDLGRWVRAAAPRLAGIRGDIRIAVDRDPVSLL
ncbi:MAG TPA: primosomal protein N' [Gemmatimonadales bacterium]|nr:primosomal protein N' [Gemmatimonadales bacterium]